VFERHSCGANFAVAAEKDAKSDLTHKGSRERPLQPYENRVLETDLHGWQSGTRGAFELLEFAIRAVTVGRPEGETTHAE
jgi:hypothetical protein